MTDLRTAAQQALEALEWLTSAEPGDEPPINAAITALRAALAQKQAEPEQEPVAWRAQNATPPGGFVIFQQYPQALADLGGEIEPLYTAAPRCPNCASLEAQNTELDRKLAELAEMEHGAPRSKA